MQARKKNLQNTFLCLKRIDTSGLTFAESQKNFIGDIPNNFENLEIKTNEQFSLSGPRFDINFNFFDVPFLIF